MNYEEFNSFQKSEYEHIATAHFETIKQVSDYFRYYLLIAAAPSFLLIFLSKDGVISIKDIMEKHTQPYNNLTGTFFLILAVVAYFVCWYIISLRHDAILYARTVNGIRKYYYQEFNTFNHTKEISYRLLPKKIYQPRYLEITLFMPVIITIALINSIYFGLGLMLLFKLSAPNFYLIIFASVFFIGHIFIYIYLSNYRENYYMKSHKIGIDIDGVLNKHRSQFSKILENVTGKILDPEKIDTIPVHENPALNVSSLDELRVFNTLEYWTTMPPIQEKFDELEKLKKIWGFKIFIFSKRGWPEFNKLPATELSGYEAQWKDKNIKSITKSWLESNGIKYDQLIIESGNTDISETTFSIFKKVFWRPKVKRVITRNRFQISKRKNIRYFVDDDPNIINKLANICDYVFVMHQPYNSKSTFPQNVIRVRSWFEIFDHIRKIG